MHEETRSNEEGGIGIVTDTTKPITMGQAADDEDLNRRCLQAEMRRFCPPVGGGRPKALAAKSG